MLWEKRAAVCRLILFNRSSVLSDGPFALFMLCTVLWWLALMPRSEKTERLGFDFMDFPHNCGSFYFLSTILLHSCPSLMSRLCPGWIPLSSVQPLDVVLRNAKEILLFSFLCIQTTHPSVDLVCLQCANRASTSPRWEIRSVQNVRLTASLTTRGRCSVAVKRTTSVLRETPWPWPVPVSLHFFLPNRPFSKIFGHS